MIGKVSDVGHVAERSSELQRCREVGFAHLSDALKGDPCRTFETDHPHVVKAGGDHFLLQLTRSVEMAARESLRRDGRAVPQQTQPRIQRGIQNLGGEGRRRKSSQAWDRGHVNEATRSAHSACLGQSFQTLHTLGQVIERPRHENGIERLVCKVELSSVAGDCRERPDPCGGGDLTLNRIDHHHFITGTSQSSRVNTRGSADVENAGWSRCGRANDLLRALKLKSALSRPRSQADILIEDVPVVALYRSVDLVLIHTSSCLMPICRRGRPSTRAHHAAPVLALSFRNYLT